MTSVLGDNFTSPLSGCRATWPTAALGALLGLLAFALLGGTHILNPHRTDWLWDTADPSTHYLGWCFFRHTPWQWPPGLNPDYGLAMGSSIIYSDSIPLMALLCKPFSPWLAADFQYTGLWILICLILQGIFAMLLAGRFAQRLLPQLLCATFLLLPAILLKRLAGHYSLVAHWPILWSLYLYFSPRPPSRRIVWPLVIAVASLIHLYLAAMSIAIWQADLLRRYLQGHRHWRPIALEYATTAIVLLCVMWLAGYFAIPLGDGRTPGAAGVYSMNLLSLIDSRGYSQFLPALPLEREGQVEGTSYLGLGLIAASVLSAFSLLRPRKNEAPRNRLWWPLILVSILLTLFAISSILTFGRHRLLSLPNYWGPLSEIFRASGRMFWPASYVLALLICTTLLRRFSYRMAVCLLVGLVTLQIVDLVPLFTQTRQHFAQPVTVEQPLRDPFWQSAARHYRKLILVPSEPGSLPWFPLARYAADHHMAINYGYFARFPWNRKEQANRDTINELQKGTLDPDALYILTDPTLTADLLPHLPPGADIRTIDGYPVLATHAPVTE